MSHIIQTAEGTGALRISEDAMVTSVKTFRAGLTGEAILEMDSIG